MEFDKRLNYLKNRFGLSGKAFAEAMNQSQSSMHGILKGDNLPRVDFCFRLVSVIPQVNLHWLLTGQGQPFFDEELNQASHDLPRELKNHAPITPSGQYWQLLYENCQQNHQDLMATKDQLIDSLKQQIDLLGKG